jgi:hypothetical protein
VSTPAVSVILPTHNRAALLAASAGSVLAQDFADLELLVVDDGSTDDIAEAVRRLDDPRARVLRRATRGGPAAARNSGVAAARAPLLAFQDSDDTWLPGKLSRQLAGLPQSSEAMSICGVLRGERSHWRHFPHAALRSAGPLAYEQVLSHPFAYAQSWLVPRAALVAAGGFDESLPVWEDWELLIRLATRLRVHVVPDVLVRSARLADSITQDQSLFLVALERIMAKHVLALQARPRSLAELTYARGRLLASADRSDDATAAFRQALRANSLHWRAAVFLAGSLAGRPTLRALQRLVGEA